MTLSGETCPTGPGPGPAGTPVEFVAELNRLRTWAGRPSLRRLERLAGERLGDGRAESLPSSTTSEVLAGKRLPRPPRLEFVEAFVAACLRARGVGEGVLEEELDRWRTAWRAIDAGAETKFYPGADTKFDTGAETTFDTGTESAAGLPAAAGTGERHPAAVPSQEPPRRGRHGRRWLTLVAVFTAGALTGVLGTRVAAGPAGHSPAPAETASGRQCWPVGAPPPPGTVAMGPVGTPSVDDTLVPDWWVTDNRIGLTVTPAGWTADVAGGTAKPSDLIVLRSGITLTAKHQYRFDFTASADRQVIIQLRIQDKAPPRYRESLLRDVEVDPSPCRQSYAFRVDATSQTTGEVTFQLGGRGSYTITVEHAILVDLGA